jgi:Icc-related predicted phosphoesterase
MQFIYATDLHGNETAYGDLFNLAEEREVGGVVFGGDILPMPASIDSFASGQRAFMTSFLRPAIEDFRSRTATEIYLMLGNDDAAVCVDELELLERGGLAKYIHMRMHEFGDLFIYGYSFVPLTHFGIKDWEKYDTTDQVSPRMAFPPFFTREGGITQIDVEKDIRPRGTIEDDFENILSETNPSKTIYVTHTPPYGTALDIIFDGRHVGSKPLRSFIEKTQPSLTLHGHIHESPSRSGRIFDKIGNTICVNPGDSKGGLNALLLDTDDVLGSMERIFKG